MKHPQAPSGRLSVALLILAVAIAACDDEATTDPGATTCTGDNTLHTGRQACTANLAIANEVAITAAQDVRTITSNSIPEHPVGPFPNSSNPNAIVAQNNTFTVDATPVLSGAAISITDNGRPAYQFGVLLNGVALDPVAAEPWVNTSTGAQNWDWNLEATTSPLGLDCNEAHVQPTGAYHYHGVPQGFIDAIGVHGDAMVLVGYAADGFPMYYKYAHEDAMDDTSFFAVMRPSYMLKAGERPGDGVAAPCGAYNGKYVADYEYVATAGDLDECNGRFGVTPEYPNGTYYYMLTDEFPHIPRCFMGTPDASFRLGPGGPPPFSP